MHPFDRNHHPARRDFLKLAGLAGLGWLTPLGSLLARAAEDDRTREPAQSVILLWLGGGPSQLDTFDPKPGTEIGGDTRAKESAVKGLYLAEGFEQLAAEMGSVSLVRSVVSKEGDHERGTYTMKTGYRPDPTVVHPSIGAVCCHELPAGVGDVPRSFVSGGLGKPLLFEGSKTEVPRHVSILPGQWPGRGGYLGDQYDAFKCYDPAQKLPDVAARVSPERDKQRVEDLDVVEQAFARGRQHRADATLHRATVENARTLMTSEQLRAFEIDREPVALRKAYGDTAFGRACLAARRLIQVGVRCVEVTLNGWDTHADNHRIVQENLKVLDPAFATLLRDLKEHHLLERTVVLCMGEFGRTPRINGLGGRDHWPNGFSVAVAGGGLRGGQVIGETDPEGKKDPTDPVKVGDVHATVFDALGIEYGKVMASPIGRTLKLSDGKPLAALKG
jgi:hypothetical protein